MNFKAYELLLYNEIKDEWLETELAQIQFLNNYGINFTNLSDNYYFCKQKDSFVINLFFIKNAFYDPSFNVLAPTIYLKNKMKYIVTGFNEANCPIFKKEFTYIDSLSSLIIPMEEGIINKIFSINLKFNFEDNEEFQELWQTHPSFNPALLKRLLHEDIYNIFKKSDLSAVKQRIINKDLINKEDFIKLLESKPPIYNPFNSTVFLRALQFELTQPHNFFWQFLTKSTSRYIEEISYFLQKRTLINKLIHPVVFNCRTRAINLNTIKSKSLKTIFFKIKAYYQLFKNPPFKQ